MRLRYMPVIEQLDSEIEQLEDEVLDRAGTPRGRGDVTIHAGPCPGDERGDG